LRRNNGGAGANEPGTTEQANFLDANLPLYTILGAGEEPASALDLVDDSASVGPQVSMVRVAPLGTPVTCAAVRDAAHP